MFKPLQKNNNSQEKEADATVHKPMLNRTGIPTQMKKQYELSSGFSLDTVRIHYNSDKPAKLQALAYTQGEQIYIGHGQEKHLGHELGHVIQQKQGIVKPTTQLNGIKINDNETLERRADMSAFGSFQKAPVSSDVVQRALVGEFGFDNADTDTDKLLYFQNQDIGIEKWILTAYEYEKQTSLAGDGSPPVDVPTLMSKLYSLREMVSNNVTVTQTTGGTTLTNPLLTERVPLVTTSMSLADNEKLSMVTHGADAEFLVIEEVPSTTTLKTIKDRYKTTEPTPEYYSNIPDTVRYYPLYNVVVGKSDNVVDHINRALPPGAQPNFYPFFCYMGNSSKAQEIYGAHVPPATGLSVATGPSLLPPGTPAGSSAHGQGFVYDGSTLEFAINGISSSAHEWDAIIDKNGSFKTVRMVIASGEFIHLGNYCSSSPADLPTKFIPALEEVIRIAFEMYNHFLNDVNKEINKTSGTPPVDIGQIF